MKVSSSVKKNPCLCFLFNILILLGKSEDNLNDLVCTSQDESISESQLINLCSGTFVTQKKNVSFPIKCDCVYKFIVFTLG